MAYTQADLDAIEEAIASGEWIVEIDGRKVQYRSINQLQDAHRFISRKLARQKRRRTMAVTMTVDKGVY
ncbi:hypothetical protein [Parendozoicomonas sp. Alg238-R29]|uniref:phage head-tail joining protein n=1 Tax=Parendozoicomonas sp. Alg238-R29 TaxID=2993446 RepID=UPI00248D4003|nr:hypothetical protein [Parendozoicomonas sp. Alg238-R29]